MTAKAFCVTIYKWYIISIDIDSLSLSQVETIFFILLESFKCVLLSMISLFVSTTSVCVTGLTTVVISEQFSMFGQVVIMCLIQIGGLRIYDIYITYTNVYR